ncbi:MAG: hypothetical protein J6V09_02650 [Clostridia bacterium]|nr:hypothetical protein [Clostridia bacterium]
MSYVNDTYDIIILAGQSNAQGCGRGETTEEYIPDPDIMHLFENCTYEVRVKDGIEKMCVVCDDPNLYIDIAKERCDEAGKISSFGLSFAREYKKAGLLPKGRKLLIVEAGVGGTGFKKKQWGVGDELYERMLRMIDYALSLNSESTLKALLWHQGEHDAFEGNPPEIFESQLCALVRAVRARYNLKDLPFISADFVNEWKNKNIDICAPIVAKIKSVTEGEGGVFIETADLLSNNQNHGDGDDIHFCRESLNILGRRYFEAYKNLLNKK